MADNFELVEMDLETKDDAYSTLITPTNDNPLKPGLNGKFFAF